ncbi:restriction endonuclease [Deinococcus arcticus]|nr:restriction endonuclease [Deinococcus arcticus]
MARATRTLNPLHFEDLEPHRFEDLVRQLAYDYRPWASIEATGRGGADDGIDIRAFEQGIVPSFEEADEEDLPLLVDSRRLWILQCKREKRIGPAQVRRYVEESVPGPEVPYGFILAAACDFSKKAYDAFRAALIGTGVQEFHLWGKAELEDMLFQPKNDHLLFAYFGISLQTRKRSKQNELRSLLTWRKRILRALDSERGVIGQDVLLLDADCQDYPLMDEVPDFETAQPWGIFRVKLMHPQHFLVLEVARHLAYADDQTGEWDVLEEGEVPVIREQLYGGPPSVRTPETSRWYRVWEEAVPRAARAEYVTMARLPLESIVGLVEKGDLAHDCPILYIQVTAEGRLFPEEFSYLLEFQDRHKQNRTLLPDPEKRISYFKNAKFAQDHAADIS